MARREAVAGYLFISPWIVGFLVFTLAAMVYSLVVSFSDYNLATDVATPVGTENYQRLFSDPGVALSLGNTFFHAVLACRSKCASRSFLARLGRGAGIFRTLSYLPKMTPTVATVSVFLLLLNGNTGAVNKGLEAIGIDGPQRLIDPAWVKPSIVLMTLWGVSGTMVIFLAALKDVPRELYEVSALDGAGPVRQFSAITVPMISGAIFFNVVVLVITLIGGPLMAVTVAGSAPPPHGPRPQPPGPLPQLPLVAFGSAYFRFPGRRILFGLVLATMMLPGTVTMVPQFLIWKNLGLIGTWIPLFGMNLFGSAFYIFLQRQFFLGLPQELFEAARLDGAGYFGMFRRIALPLSIPSFVIIFIFEFQASWNKLQASLIYLNAGSVEGFTVPLGLSYAMTAFGQRYFVEGIATQGRKG